MGRLIALTQRFEGKLRQLHVKPFRLISMKKAFTLFLALCLSGALFAQKRASFGVVANVGNYTMPQSKNIQQGGWSTAKYNNGPGLLYQFGFWYAYRLNVQFSLSAEILFGQSSLSSSWRSDFTYPDIDSLPIFSEGERMRSHATLSSLTLPVKLRYNIEENGKTSIALGTGITFPISSKSKMLDQHGNHLYFGNERVRGIGNFSPQFNFSFGVFRQMDKATQLGFEYMFGLVRNADEGNYYYRICCIGPCYPLYPPAVYTNMKSFSVSLRHHFLN